MANARSVPVRRVMMLVGANAHSSRADRARRGIARAEIVRSVENPAAPALREANLSVVSRAVAGPLAGARLAADPMAADPMAASVRHATGASLCGLSAGALAGGR